MPELFGSILFSCGRRCPAMHSPVSCEHIDEVGEVSKQGHVPLIEPIMGLAGDRCRWNMRCRPLCSEHIPRASRLHRQQHLERPLELCRTIKVASCEADRCDGFASGHVLSTDTKPAIPLQCYWPSQQRGCPRTNSLFWGPHWSEVVLTLCLSAYLDLRYMNGTRRVRISATKVTDNTRLQFYFAGSPTVVSFHPSSSQAFCRT